LKRRGIELEVGGPPFEVVHAELEDVAFARAAVLIAMNNAMRRAARLLMRAVSRHGR